MEIRTLTVKDVFTLTRALSRVKPPDNTGNAQQFGLSLILSAFRDAEDELIAWLADMAGVEKEDFATMPAAAVLEVIEAISQQEGAKDFFGRLSKLLGVRSSSPPTTGPTTS